jgi:hypothetical protein
MNIHIFQLSYTVTNLCCTSGKRTDAVDRETQSILGLLKHCLEMAAAGRLWAEQGQEDGCWRLAVA